MIETGQSVIFSHLSNQGAFHFKMGDIIKGMRGRLDDMSKFNFTPRY